MGDENPIRTLGDYSKPSHEVYRNTIKLTVRNNVVPLRSDTIRTAKLRNDILMFQQHQGESLLEAWTRFKDLLLKVPHHGIDLWLQNDPMDFAKLVKAISLPQDVPMVPPTLSTAWKIINKPLLNMHPRDEAGGLVSNFMASQDARLSKFEADFKQQQREMTNKIDTVLKAITDRIAGALPSDTVKKVKLNTSLVLSARSYPTEDPQCSTQIHSSINAVIICPKQPNKPQNDESEGEDREERSNPENIDTTLPYPHLRKNDDSCKEGPEDKWSTTIEGLEVVYFDTFLTRSELAYHRYLMSGPIPSLFLRNPIITEGCPLNLRIPCNIGHVHVERAYIDLNSPLNVMTRMLYNWIMRRKLDPREDTNKGVRNFTGRIKEMHVFVGNFTYVTDFMIVEDISSIIDPRLSKVVLGKPFIGISNMTHDPPEGVVRFINGTDEIAYKMPDMIEQYNSLSDLEKEHMKSVYLRNEEDKIRGVGYVMSKILGFYKECLELGLEYVTGMNDGGKVT
ncbi:hypothetical protein Tco_1555680 [Tanacetum coccineum]